MTQKEITDYINSVRWKFAKTMPQHPHEYTLKAWEPEKTAIFERFVLHIRAVGHPQKWGKRTFIYLEHSGWIYWTMGNPLEKTILINRAKL